MRYVLVDADPALHVASAVRHPLGERPQPILDRVASHWLIQGGAAGVRAVTVVAANPSDREASVRLTATVAGRPVANDRLTMPPWGHAAGAVMVPNVDGEVRIVVSGDPVAVHWIRWDGDRLPYR